MDDAKPFEQEVASLDLSQPGYSLDVWDCDNLWLDGEGHQITSEEDEDEGDEEEGGLGQEETPEDRLARLSDEAEGRRKKQYHLDPPSQCDYCSCDLTNHRFFVDGRERGGLRWGNMCAECFWEVGEGIRWGDGQLYARQPDGKWLMTGGFDDGG